MMQFVVPLQERWEKLTDRLRASVSPEVRSQLFNGIVVHYSEEHRGYHNLQHVAECLRELDDVRHLCIQPDVVEYALWSHDVIYDPHCSDNEKKSAEWAAYTATFLGMPPAFREEAHRLVMATTHKKQPADVDGRFMVDIDLTILGAQPLRFDEYEAGIRQEYAFVPEADFRKGRSAILQRFLDRPSIYCTDHFQRMYENRARSNLRQSIAKLSR